MALAAVIKSALADISSARVYELSSAGPLVNFLRKDAGELTLSEFFDGVPSGAYVGQVQCQNVEALTFANESFDLCTSTDVFEHVADDAAGFKEMNRVLRPGGKLVFTVPISINRRTVERAYLTDSGIEHILTPEYHNDRHRGVGKVLAYRDYGFDIVDRLSDAGFSAVCLDRSAETQFLGHGRAVVTATK